MKSKCRELSRPKRIGPLCARAEAARLLYNPIDVFPAMEAALSNVARSLPEASHLDQEHNPLHVGLEGSFGALHTTPRFINAKFLARMISIDGIVTSCK